MVFLGQIQLRLWGGRVSACGCAQAVGRAPLPANIAPYPYPGCVAFRAGVERPPRRPHRLCLVPQQRPLQPSTTTPNTAEPTQSGLAADLSDKEAFIHLQEEVMDHRCGSDVSTDDDDDDDDDDGDNECQLRDLANRAVDWSDRASVIARMALDGLALENATDVLQGDKAVVLAAVAQCGFAMAYASETLQDDPDVVLAAVTQDGEAFQHASTRLGADQGLALAAIAQSAEAMMHTGWVWEQLLEGDGEGVAAGIPLRERLSAAKEFLISAVSRNGRALMYGRTALECVSCVPGVKKALLGDRDVMLAAVRQNHVALMAASDELLHADSQVLLAAVASGGSDTDDSQGLAPLDLAVPTLRAAPSLRRAALCADRDARAALCADPATAWAVEVEFQAIVIQVDDLRFVNEQQGQVSQDTLPSPLPIGSLSQYYYSYCTTRQQQAAAR